MRPAWRISGPRILITDPWGSNNVVVDGANSSVFVLPIFEKFRFIAYRKTDGPTILSVFLRPKSPKILGETALKPDGLPVQEELAALFLLKSRSSESVPPRILGLLADLLVCGKCKNNEAADGPMPPKNDRVMIPGARMFRFNICFSFQVDPE
jgi:hypothetical protein